MNSGKFPVLQAVYVAFIISLLYLQGGGWANDVYFLHNFAPEYKAHGCYRDRSQRAMGSLQGARKNRNDSIEKCYQDAITNGYTMFGLQHGGECWAGDKIEVSYSKYGEADNCKDGLGGGWANNVYSVSKYALSNSVVIHEPRTV